MGYFFRKENLKKTIITAVYLVVGLLFCILLENMFNFVESALCAILFCIGAGCVIIYSLMPPEDREFKLLIYGIVGVAFGVFMLLWPRFFGIILSVIVGYNGIILIVQGIHEKKSQQKTWITGFVIGVVVTVLAVVSVILSGTNSAKIILSIFFGIMFLIEGIFNLVNMILLSKQEKEQNAIISSIKEVSEEDVKLQNEASGVEIVTDVNNENLKGN